MASRTAFHKNIRNMGKFTVVSPDVKEISDRLDIVEENVNGIIRPKINELETKLTEILDANVIARLQFLEEKVEELVENLETWCVEGVVKDDCGSPMEGLKVSVYDKDSIFSGRLGFYQTGNDGYFKFSYKAENFRDLVEKNPDIFVKVEKVEHGKPPELLYTTEEAVRWESGRSVHFEITISKSGSGKSRKSWSEYFRKKLKVSGF